MQSSLAHEDEEERALAKMGLDGKRRNSRHCCVDVGVAGMQLPDGISGSDLRSFIVKVCI